MTAVSSSASRKYQNSAMKNRCCRPRQHQRQRQDDPLQRDDVLDEARAQPGEAEEELDREREQDGPERAPHELADVVAPRHVGRRGAERHHDPAEAEPAEVGEIHFAPVEPADGDQDAADADQDQAAHLDPADAPEEPRGMGGEQRRLAPPLDAREPAPRPGATPTRSSGMADDAQVDARSRPIEAAPAAASRAGAGAQLRVTGSTIRPPMKIRAPLRWTWTLLQARSM